MREYIVSAERIRVSACCFAGLAWASVDAAGDVCNEEVG